MAIFFINYPSPTEIYTLSLHDALPICLAGGELAQVDAGLLILKLFRAADEAERRDAIGADDRSEEHTSELQSRGHLVCRLLLEKKKKSKSSNPTTHRSAKHTANT